MLKYCALWRANWSQATALMSSTDYSSSPTGVPTSYLLKRWNRDHPPIRACTRTHISTSTHGRPSLHAHGLALYAACGEPFTRTLVHRLVCQWHLLIPAEVHANTVPHEGNTHGFTNIQCVSERGCSRRSHCIWFVGPEVLPLAHSTSYSETIIYTKSN